MKIALILGRGIEGAGVTRYMIEICSFLKTKDIEHQVYVVDDKKWGRGKAQDMPDYKFITKENILTFADTLNTFDYVFINSVPSVKHSQWAQDGFLAMVQGHTLNQFFFCIYYKCRLKQTSSIGLHHLFVIYACKVLLQLKGPRP